MTITAEEADPIAEYWHLVEVRDAARQLVRLLDDPEPGLFTWHDCVREQAFRIADVCEGRT